MIDKHRNYHTKYILTLVFSSIFLVSFGLIVHNAFADQVVATIPVNGAFGVATNPNTDMTYVANGHSYQIQVIDDKTNTVVATVEPASALSGSYGCYTYTIAVNPATNIVYTNNNACVYWPPSSAPAWIPQTVSVINGTNNKVIAVDTISRIMLSSEPPQPIAVNPTTKMIYALANVRTSQSTPSYVAVINGTTNQVTSNIAMPDNQASDITINSQTNTIYVLDGNIIFVIDGNTDSIVKNFSWGKSSNEGIGVNPTTNRIYVSNSDNTVSVIDGSTDQVISTVNGTAYGFVGVNPVTNKVYVTYPSSHFISVINGSTNTLTSQVYVGAGPSGIGVNTDTNKIYVGNSGSGTVSVIDGTIPNTSSVPTSPQNLQATTMSSSQINLSWTTPTNNGGSPITGYGIERSTDAGTSWSTIVTSINSTTYSNTGLLPSTTYAYKVSAHNWFPGTSSESNSASAATSASSGTIVLSNLQTTSGTTSSSNQITLANFNAGTGSNRLLVVGVSANNNDVLSVKFGGVSPSASSSSSYDGLWIFVNPSGAKNIVVTFSGPTSAVVGAYAFAGVDDTNPVLNMGGGGTMTTSNPTASLITQYPNDWVLEHLSVYGGVTLSNPTCMPEWNISASGIITGASSLASSASPGPVSCGWSTSKSTGAWENNVIEIKSAGSASNTSTVPSAPQNLQSTAGNSQVTLSWTVPSNNGGSAITNYNVYRGTSSGSETLLTQIGNLTSYNDNTVTNGKTYFYKVTAVNSVGESVPSNEASATPVASTTSGIVLNNIQSTSGTTSSSNQITLSNFNAGTGSNQLLLVGVSANNNNVISITFGGATLTQKVMSFYNNDAEFWYLKNPSGTGDIVVTMAGPTQAVVGAYSFSGVNQTSPIPTKAIRHNTTPNSPTISITTKYPNDLVFDLPSIYGGSTLGSPTCTQQWDLNVPNAITGASSSTMVSSPGLVTCKWTASSGDMWDDVAVEIKASR